MTERELVIRIRLDEDTPNDVRALVAVLTEDEKPEWRKKLFGWRSGPKGLSSRAIALMVEAQRKQSSETEVMIMSSPKARIAEVNDFG